MNMKTPTHLAAPRKGNVKARTRPTCPNCNRYADREQDVKGRFYVACYGCGYDSRYSGPSIASLGIKPPAALPRRRGRGTALAGAK